jgi:PEP-CTERM motif
VPEPATTALPGMGMLALVIALRRRNLMHQICRRPLLCPRYSEGLQPPAFEHAENNSSVQFSDSFRPPFSTSVEPHIRLARPHIIRLPVIAVSVTVLR